MTWRLDFPKPQILVYYLAKLMGLAPFTVNKNKIHPPTVFGALYPVTVIVVYSTFTWMTFNDTVLNTSAAVYLKLRNFMVTVQHFLHIPSTIVTVTMFWFMRKKIVCIINTLLIVSNELKSFKIVENQENYFKNLLATIAFANSVFIALHTLMGFMEAHWEVNLSIKYTIGSWFAFNVILIFIQLLLCIRQRFTLVNRKLCDMFTPARKVRSFNDLRMFAGNGRPRSEDLTDLQCVQKLEGLHMELCEMVEQTTSIFAVPIILTSLQIFTEIILSCYFIYYILRGTKLQHDSSDVVSFVIKHFSCSILKIVILVIELLSIAWASATTCREGNATKAVLSKVWNNLTPEELKDEFFIFSLQLMHKRVAVSAFGFLNLDYSYLYQMSCAVVAYVIIVIQFGSP